jgi:hypothetical protein
MQALFSIGKTYKDSKCLLYNNSGHKYVILYIAYNICNIQILY